VTSTMNGFAGILPVGGRTRVRPSRLVAVLALLACSAWPVRADDLVVSVVHKDGIFEVRGRFTARASVDTAWRVLTDYEGIPRFVESMKLSAVERRDGPRVRLRQVGSVGLFPMRKTARLTLEVLEQEPTRIAFRDTLGQDFHLYTGAWSLKPDSTRTIVEYALDATPTSAVPHWIGRSMMSHATRDLLRQVHAEIERRAGTR